MTIQEALATANIQVMPETSWGEALTLIRKGENVKARDKGFHLIMDLANSNSNSNKKWRQVLAVFREYSHDLRPGVTSRAAESAPEGLRRDFELLHLRTGALCLINMGGERRKRGVQLLLSAAEQGVFEWDDVVAEIASRPADCREEICDEIRRRAPETSWEFFRLEFGREALAHLAKKEGRYAAGDIALMHLVCRVKGEAEAGLILRDLGRLPHSVYGRIKTACRSRRPAGKKSSG